VGSSCLQLPLALGSDRSLLSERRSDSLLASRTSQSTCDMQAIVVSNAVPTAAIAGELFVNMTCDLRMLFDC
jgi:hypothetical protein